MLSDSTPRTLAALHARKRRTTREEEAEIESLLPPTPGKPGQQLGLLFQQPEEEQPKPQKKERRIWSVAALVSDLRKHVEDDYADEWVEGEISNCRLAPSGHLYLTLKDEDAQLPVVMFRREASALKFRPEDGQSVLVRGSVSVYENRGQLQLIATSIEPRGEGALRLAFEQLRQKLLAEGLFDAERKRPLPRFPQTVGIITSPAGAVLRDICNVTQRRHRCLNLLVFPALMQGSESPREVQKGLHYFNTSTRHRVDLIMIARGGGSAEDLWCFNDEGLARAIAASELPVISAIGHETDFTIADFVADLRAPTPSAAAEIVTAAHVAVHDQIVSTERRLERAIRYQLLHARQRYAHIQTSTLFSQMGEFIGRRQQHIDMLVSRMQDALSALLKQRCERLAKATRALASNNITQQIHAQCIQQSALVQRLHRNMDIAIQRRRMRLNSASARLSALNPNAVLQRGYALVLSETGNVIRSASQVQSGEQIIARVANGEIRARVTQKEEQ
ncbi:MAG: exodeoxyribonuclease VII large subunit [Acidobacteria bacterium]|nr:exodeoxyribonuclease VII large subunit [Acidobacteriota bacterium]